MAQSKNGRYLKKVNGILLIYHHPPVENAPTILDHVHSFKQYSQFKVLEINTMYGFPEFLKDYQFSIILLHYSLTGGASYPLSNPFWNYLASATDSHKILFAQDENYNCGQRFRFINQYKIDWIYSVLDPKYYQEIYHAKCPSIKRVFHTLTGYVSENMLAKAKQYAKPWDKRTIDVGYRARVLPPYLGKGATEKQEIGLKFLSEAKFLNLKLDIKVNEGDRLYGDNYYKWLGNCKAILGIESGGTIFDLEDEVWNEYWKKPRSYAEMPPELMSKWEDKIFYRTISPRHFEATAFGCAQILYEGCYNDILLSWAHYVELKKDWSNFDKIAYLIKKNGLKSWANELRLYLGDGRHSYQNFIEEFDQNLTGVGFNPEDKPEFVEIDQQLHQYMKSKRLQHLLELAIFTPYYKQWLGRGIVIEKLFPVVKTAYCKIKGYKKGVTG